MNPNKNILLTGGSGFIGRNIIEQLGEKYSITAPTHAELGLLDPEQVNNFFKDKYFDVVIHATAAGVSRANAGEPLVFKHNTEMFLNLAKNKFAYNRLIFLGSGAEYDKSRALVKVKEAQFGESKPKDEYGMAKYFISEEIKKHEGFMSLRCFGVFGKYEDYAIRFISNAICRSLAGMPIVLKQNKVFDYIYVNDLVKVIKYFIEHEPKERFYNAGGEVLDLLSIARLVQEVTNNKFEIEIKEQGSGPEYSGDNTLLKNELGNFEFTPIEKAIEELTLHYKENWEKVDVEKLNFDA